MTNNHPTIPSEITDKMREIIKLKKRVASYEADVKQWKNELKLFMREHNTKVIEVEGVKFSYIAPREYEDFYNKKMAFDYIRENRKDLIVKKTGYETLRMSLAKV